MRRFLSALVIAIALSVVVERVADLAVPEICKMLDPDTNWFLYWWNNCGKDVPGGGGGGAS